MGNINSLFNQYGDLLNNFSLDMDKSISHYETWYLNPRFYSPSSNTNMGKPG